MSVCRFKEKRKKIKEVARTKTPLEPGKSSKKHTYRAARVVNANYCFVIINKVNT